MRSDLRWKDRIAFESHELVFLEGALALCDSGPDTVEYKKRETALPADPPDWSLPPCRRIELDLPPLQAMPENRTSSSAALMMLVSSAATMVCSLSLLGGDWKGVLASSLSTLSMAAAMSALSVHSKKKARLYKRRQETERLQNYQACLERALRTARQDAQKILEQTITLQKRLACLDASLPDQPQTDWMLPLTICQQIVGQPEIHGRSPDPGDPCSLLLESVLCEPVTAPAFQCVKRGETVLLNGWSASQIEFLFLLWKQMITSTRRRLVWIGWKAPVSTPCCCRLQGQPLYFDSWQSFLKSAQNAQMEWTVFARKEPPMKMELPDATLVLFDVSMRNVRQLAGSPVASSSQMPADVIRRALMSRIQPQTSGQLLLQLMPESTPPDQPACLRIRLSEEVVWDLRQDGPHALVAGSTGSGKSEGLSLALLQLCAINSSRQLQLIVIDFKGGSFASQFSDLPHCAGMLTNLSGGSIERMQKALAAELDRRQKCIARAVQNNPLLTADADHCLQADQGHSLSELIVCVDEFGQLKARAPEFLRSLCEMARIGRSLGVHLILSTQKPAGLVDEQIWANSRSRLCFRVLDAGDSREVLGHEKASKLTQPGQFILQCGGQREACSRAFYLKQSALFASPIWIKDESGSWQEAVTPTLQEHLMHRIQAAGAPDRHSWILAPDPLEQVQASDAIIEDCIDHVRRWKICPGQSVALGGKRDRLFRTCRQYAASSTEPVVSTMELEEADQIVSLWDLYALQKRTSPVCVIVSVDADFPEALLEMLMEEKHIALLAVFENPDYRFESLLGRMDGRIAFEMSTREAEAAFFGRVREHTESGPAALGWIDGQPVRIVFGQQMPVQTERSWKPLPRICPGAAGRQLLMQENPSSALAVETRTMRPRMLQPPFAVAWSSPQGEELAGRVIRRAQLIDPSLLAGGSLEGEEDILCLDLSRCDLQAAARKLALRPMLFAGAGLESFQYALHLDLPTASSGDGWLIEKGKAADVLLCALRADE